MGAPLRNWIFRLLLLLAAFATVVAIRSAPLPLWARLGILAVVAGAALDQAFRRVPAFDPLGRVRWHLPSTAGAKRCALTFDDGPSPATAAVLDILAAEGVPATFFVLGANAEGFRGSSSARDEGHAVGIHGMDHATLAGAAPDAIECQVSGVTRVLARLA